MKITIEKNGDGKALVRVWETDAGLEREICMWPVDAKELLKNRADLWSAYNSITIPSVTGCKVTVLETS